MGLQRLRTAFAVVLAVLVGIAGLSFLGVREILDNEREVARTYDVLRAVRNALEATRDAETRQRSYLISASGDAGLLQSYRVAADTARRKAARLRQLVSDNPPQVQRAALLDTAVAQAITWTDTLVAVQQTAGAEAARVLSRTGQGLARMDRVREAVFAIEAVEDVLLDERMDGTDRSARGLLLTLALTTLIGIALVVFVYQISIRELDARARQAAELERRVAARTADLEAEVAERQAAEAALQASKAELERSNRELQDFAYVASHDLQEPLRKIRSFADLLQTDYGPGMDAEAQRYLDRMQDASTRMSHLISDLLTFSRVSARPRAPEPVALDAVVRGVLTDLEVAIAEADADVRVGPLPTVAADPMQMRQLFQNLVGNALKFRRQDVRPVVEVAADTVALPSGGGAAVVRVRDNGIGFDEKYLDRIFTPFQRLHTRTAYDGTGIGLAVCRKIAERHGGDITARSTPGEGTTFFVTLPIGAPAPAAPAPTPTAADA